MLIVRLFMVGVALLFPGCNNSGFTSGGGKRVAADQQPAIQSLEIETFTLVGEKTESGQVDVVFVVDTSGSMYEEKDLLEKNLSSFLLQFQNRNADVDYQIHIVGRDFDFPNMSGNVNLVGTSVGSNDALAILYNFIHFGINGQFVRPTSTVEAVIITDDNAKRDLSVRILPYPNSDFGNGDYGQTYDLLDADDFTELMSVNHPNLNLHINGLVGKTEGRVNDWCHISETGTEYEKLAAMPRFKGLVADLCTDDWSPLLSELAANIIKRVEQAVIKLQFKPDLQRGYSVKLNGELIESDQVSISETGAVTLRDPALQRQSGSLEISYIPLR